MELLIKNSASRQIAIVIFLLVFTVGFVIVSLSAGEKFYTSTPVLISIPAIIIGSVWFTAMTIKNGTFVLLLSTDGVLIKLQNGVNHLIKWENIESIKSSFGIALRDYTPCTKSFNHGAESDNNLYISFQDNNPHFHNSPMCNGEIYEKKGTEKKIIIANLTQDKTKVLSKISAFRSSQKTLKINKA